MCKVSIDNEIFDTMNDAADFLELTPQKLSAILLDKKQVNINGFNVKKLGKDKIVTKLMCIETQEVFNTMTDLANSLGIPMSRVSKAFQDGDCFIHDGKRYYRLSEKSDIRMNRSKGYKQVKRPEPELGEYQDSQDDDKFLKVNMEENEMPIEEQLGELVEVTKKETAEQVIQNLVIRFINSKEYDTASVLLKILNEHGEELNR